MWMLGFPTLLSDLFVGVRDCLVGFAGDHGRYCSGNLWCRGWESNPHRPEARGILSPLRLPFPPPRRTGKIKQLHSSRKDDFRQRCPSGVYPCSPSRGGGLAPRATVSSVTLAGRRLSSGL